MNAPSRHLLLAVLFLGGSPVFARIPDARLETTIVRIVPATTEIRHQIHLHPELSNREFQTAEHLRAQVPGTAGHEHLTEVACVDVPPGEKRPEFGCFNIGMVTGLHFSQASVYWHLRAFPSRKAAEAAKSATGIVVEEDGRVWLSEFGPRNTAPRGGDPIAVVGPLQLPAAKSYAAVLSYAVMRPGDNSRAHTHPGPEGWYVLAGEQCLETPAGANRARAGGTMTVRSNIPMELNVTGTTLRRAFAVVIHDSAQERGIPSDWKPSGACSQ